MQYNQIFYNQQCSDNSARNIRLSVENGSLIFSASTVDLPDAAHRFETEFYLDEQDREALAEALVPSKFEPRLHWSELVAIGLIGGLLAGFVCGILTQGVA